MLGCLLQYGLCWSFSLDNSARVWVLWWLVSDRTSFFAILHPFHQTRLCLRSYFKPGLENQCGIPPVRQMACLPVRGSN